MQAQLTSAARAAHCRAVVGVAPVHRTTTSPVASVASTSR
jgi:hypothetical protein